MAKDKSTAGGKAKKKAAKAARGGNKVPAMAENMEHTLRRLVRERNARRLETPELYR